MRRVVKNQQKLNKFMTFVDNDLFIDYISEITKEYTGDPNYNIVVKGQNDNFIMPGRLELDLDGHKAYLELSSDILSAIYQIVAIKNNAMRNRFEDGESIDIQKYEWYLNI